MQGEGSNQLTPAEIQTCHRVGEKLTEDYVKAFRALVKIIDKNVPERLRSAMEFNNQLIKSNFKRVLGTIPNPTLVMVVLGSIVIDLVDQHTMGEVRNFLANLDSYDSQISALVKVYEEERDGGWTDDDE